MDYYEKEKARICKLRTAASQKLMKLQKKDLVQFIVDQSDEDTLEKWVMRYRAY